MYDRVIFSAKFLISPALYNLLHITSIFWFQWFYNFSAGLEPPTWWFRSRDANQHGHRADKCISWDRDDQIIYPSWRIKGEWIFSLYFRHCHAGFPMKSALILTPSCGLFFYVPKCTKLGLGHWQVAWPSGLRRWFKAPVSSEAWVRIPPLPTLIFYFPQRPCREMWWTWRQMESKHFWWVHHKLYL